MRARRCPLAKVALALVALAPLTLDCAGSARPPHAKALPVCDDGVILEGACVPAKLAATYCGKATVYRDGGCLALPCPSGRPRDETSGVCVSSATLREVAHDVELDDDHTLGCDGDKMLLVDQSHARCVDPAESCGRGARWADAGCGAVRACPPGQLADGTVCVPFVRGASGDGARVVDVGRWVRLVIGPDGGDGTPEVCAPIARRPWLFSGLSGPQPVLLRAQITLIFPDNDVTRVHVRFGLSDATRRPAPEPALGLLEQSAGPMVEALRAAGGVSSAASATTTVTCRLLETGDPVPRPRSEPPRSEAQNEPR